MLFEENLFGEAQAAIAGVGSGLRGLGMLHDLLCARLQAHHERVKLFAVDGSRSVLIGHAPERSRVGAQRDAGALAHELYVLGDFEVVERAARIRVHLVEQAVGECARPLGVR